MLSVKRAFSRSCLFVLGNYIFCVKCSCSLRFCVPVRMVLPTQCMQTPYSEGDRGEGSPWSDFKLMKSVAITGTGTSVLSVRDDQHWFPREHNINTQLLWILLLLPHWQHPFVHIQLAVCGACSEKESWKENEKHSAGNRWKQNLLMQSAPSASSSNNQKSK